DSQSARRDHEVYTAHPGVRCEGSQHLNSKPRPASSCHGQDQCLQAVDFLVAHPESLSCTYSCEYGLFWKTNSDIGRAILFTVFMAAIREFEFYIRTAMPGTDPGSLSNAMKRLARVVSFAAAAFIAVAGIPARASVSLLLEQPYGGLGVF